MEEFSGGLGLTSGELKSFQHSDGAPALAGVKCALAEVARGAIRPETNAALCNATVQRPSPDGLDYFAPPLSGVAGFIETTS